MANRNSPSGLRPVKHAHGGEIRHGDGYTIASGYATSIFTGDPVKSSGTGRGIEVAAAGDRMLGVFAGCSYTDATGAPVFSAYWPAGTVATDVEALVYDDPGIVFEAQMSASVAAADIDQLTDLVAGTGNVKTGLSGYEVDSASIGGVGKAGVKLMGLSPAIDNEYGTHAKVWIMLSEHENGPALTAV